MPSAPPPSTHDRGYHRLRLAVGILLLAALVTLLVIYPVPVWRRLRLEWWPLDNSTLGPNMVVFIIVGLLGYLLVRPVQWLIGDYRRRLDRNARLMQHLIEHMDSVPNENRHGHSMLNDEFMQDPPPNG